MFRVWNFNSHAHVERDPSSMSSDKDVLYFNSHAHVERDGARLVTSVEPNISTHTLTWSVTAWRKSRKLSIKFQLTRSRGA